MQLSPSEKIQFQDFLRNAGFSGNCHVCGTNHWSVEGLAAAPEVTKQFTTVLGGILVPTVQLICDRCGYIMHFAAKAVGLIP